MHPCCATLVVATEQVATNYTCPNPMVIESGQNNLKQSLFFGKNNFSHTHSNYNYVIDQQNIEE